MKKTTIKNNDFSGRYMTPQQAAAYLNVCLRTLRTLMAKKQIPYTQLNGTGSLVRIDREEIDRIMREKRVGA